MFIDEVTIHVSSGRGGDGLVHFHREKFVARGGPDGGDGGKGGDIIIVANPHMNTLYSFKHQAKYRADDGKKGGINDQTGRSAENKYIPVPAGTIVYDALTGQVLGDLVTEGQELIVCKGGRGGRGNPHFVNSHNQVPRTGERGEPAEIKDLRLELKLIADVGIIGQPNAGKSSLLAAVTNAKPKIANYPFTTIEPNLGVAALDDDNQLVLADIPGLIEGAHEGVGLGYAFLRHIQRCRVLIHLVDGSAENPLSDYSQINSELALFDPLLAKKPQVVVINKIDLLETKEKLSKVKAAFKRKGIEVMTISALGQTDLKPVLWKTKELLASAPVVDLIAEMPVYKPAEDASAFEVTREEGGWRVVGKSIERAADMTYWDLDESVRRFQRLMERLGVDEALRSAGVQEGESVFIGENEFEWQE
jgi:GTPase